MKRFFKIPALAVITPNVNPEDVYIRWDLVRGRNREQQVINGQPTAVVVLEGTGQSVVRDGEWSQQLDSCVGGCNGGILPPPSGNGTVRTAYGGMFQAVPTGYDEINFTTPGEWVVLTNDVVQLVGYEPGGTDEVVYDLVENSMTLDWADPAPTTRQFAQITVFWSVASVGNDQTYEFGVLLNGVDVTPPSGRAVMSYERAGDVETLAQQGQGALNNGDKLQLVVRNVNGTNPLRLYTVNARVTVSALADAAA